jgi:hypothetical protein
VFRLARGVKRHARLRHLREADGHVDVRGGKVGSPAAAVAVAVVDEAAEVEPSVEIVLGGDALAERQRTLELRGFYERMLETQKGALNGDYIMPEEIEMRSPNRVSQLLEEKRGITVRRVGGCNIIVTCFRVYGQGGCVATIFLDVQRVNPLRVASNDLSGAPAVDELIPVSGVSGIEVYPRGALAPPKFQSLGGTCAIVLIWTR